MRVDWFSSVRGDGGDGEAHCFVFLARVSLLALVVFPAYRFLGALFLRVRERYPPRVRAGFCVGLSVGSVSHTQLSSLYV